MHAFVADDAFVVIDVVAAVNDLHDFVDAAKRFLSLQ